MGRKTRAVLILVAVISGSAGCDHASKQIAVATLARTGSVSIAGDSLRLELALNPGAFLGLGSSLPAAVQNGLFLVGVPLLVAGFCIQLLRRREPATPLLIGLGLVAGGGLANWLDRLLHGGAVTDFITLGVGPLRTGVFNLADAAIVVGVLLLLFARGGRSEGEAACPGG